jgi:hypothetical protein
MTGELEVLVAGPEQGRDPERSLLVLCVPPLVHRHALFFAEEAEPDRHCLVGPEGSTKVIRPEFSARGGYEPADERGSVGVGESLFSDQGLPGGEGDGVAEGG